MSIDEAFEVLGLTIDASDNEIKKAYRELIKKYHPDSNGGDKYKDELQLVQEAYEIIKYEYEAICELREEYKRLKKQQEQKRRRKSTERLAPSLKTEEQRKERERREEEAKRQEEEKLHEEERKRQEEKERVKQRSEYNEQRRKQYDQQRKSQYEEEIKQERYTYNTIVPGYDKRSFASGGIIGFITAPFRLTLFILSKIKDLIVWIFGGLFKVIMNILDSISEVVSAISKIVIVGGVLWGGYYFINGKEIIFNLSCRPVLTVTIGVMALLISEIIIRLKKVLE